MKQLAVKGLVMAVVLSGASLAQAQGESPAPGAAPAAEAAAPAQAAGGDAGGAVEDGGRFRFGVSGGAGFFTAADEAGVNELSCTYYGIDLRFGAQLSHLVGVYAQPTIGYYSVDGAGTLAAGGLLGIAGIADFTLIDQVFVGGGLGYTIYNNPAGISPILRVGAYPFMGHSDDKPRRKGLMVGLDLRMTGLEGLKTIVMPTLNIGYEAF